MPHYKTHAIILRSYDFKDYDKILVLYSADKGLFRAIAKGIKRPKSSISARLEPLMAVNLLLYEGRNLDKISQAETIDPFKYLRLDLKKLTFAMCYAELATAFGMENDHNSAGYYDFLFQSLKDLETAPGDVILEAYLVQFQYKIISMAGYQPMLNYCNSCRKDFSSPETIYFDPNSGTFNCYNCSKNLPNTTCLNDDTFEYFNNLHQSPAGFYSDNKTVTLKAFEIMRDYINQKSNLNLKTSDLIENICINCG